jgi:hypothetical protein
MARDINIRDLKQGEKDYRYLMIELISVQIGEDIKKKKLRNGSL